MLLVKTSTPHRFSDAVAADGVSISYEELGSGDPLVLLHGLTDNRNPGTRPAMSSVPPARTAADPH